MTRTVTLVLVDAAGVPLGALPPYDVQTPWWQDVGPVVAGARLRFGVDVDVLRLLDAEREEPPGGPVTYAAQLRAGTPERLLPVGDAGRVHPARAPWAQPNGPAASVDWAVRQLSAVLPREVRAVQLRTWNLAGIWRLDADYAAVAWLKQVPPSRLCEAGVLELLAEAAPGLAPRLIAVGPHGRLLIAHAPGGDRADPGPAFRAAIAAQWHPVQERLAGGIDKLLDSGVRDLRGGVARIRQVAVTRRAEVPGLAELAAGLADRFAEVAACGVPDTLIHGDLHPGNVRADGDGPLTIFDWGAAGVGHPAYDILRLTDGVDPAEAAPLLQAWAERWRTAVPGSDPARAARLLRPVAALRAAVAAVDVLAAVDPAERKYHAATVPHLLGAAVAAA